MAGVHRLQMAIERHRDTEPVPVWTIASEAGWHVATFPDMGRVMGVAVVLPDRPVVCLLNEDLCSCGQRVVLAHEMGHVILGHTATMHLHMAVGNNRDLGPWLSAKQEREADEWAADLLIPSRAVGLYEPDELAHVLEVPEWLVALRLMT